MPFGTEYTHTLQSNNLNQTSQHSYYKIIIRRVKYKLEVIWLGAKNITDLELII